MDGGRQAGSQTGKYRVVKTKLDRGNWVAISFHFSAEERLLRGKKGILI
jgi:hypothetical protein